MRTKEQANTMEKEPVVLKNKVYPDEVKLKRLKRDGFSGIGRYANCVTRLAPSLDSMGNPVTGLSYEEEEEMEKLMRLPKGTLSKGSDFWVEFHIPIGNDDLILRPASNPDDLLQYKFLLKDTLVAVGEEGKAKKPDAEYLLTDDNQEAKLGNQSRSFTKRAYTIFSKMSTAEMRNYLTIHGVKSEHITAEVVENEVGRRLDANPQKFVEVMEDDNLSMKLLFVKAVDMGIINKIGRGVRAPLFFNDQPLGAGEYEAIPFLLLPKNQQILAAIQSQVSRNEKGL